MHDQSETVFGFFFISFPDDKSIDNLLLCNLINNNLFISCIFSQWLILYSLFFRFEEKYCCWSESISSLYRDEIWKMKRDQVYVASRDLYMVANAFVYSTIQHISLSGFVVYSNWIIGFVIVSCSACCIRFICNATCYCHYNVLSHYVLTF